MKYTKVGNRTYYHKSVLKLIERHHEISKDPQEIIRYLTREKLADLKTLNSNAPPFDPKLLASLLSIPCEESVNLFRSDDAELHPAENGRGYVIRYNPNKPKKRQNFSIAHEIAHTFFPEFHYQYKTRHKIGKFDLDNEVEFLCDLGASEIIMPTPDFDLDVESRGISIKSLQELSKRYEASLEATAIRMIGTDVLPCALTVLDYSHKPSEKDEIERSKYQQSLFDDFPLEPPLMKLRVQYSVRTNHFSAYIPRDKSVEELSPLHKVSVTQEPFQGNILLNFTNPVLDTYVEAIALPKRKNSGHDSRVLVFVFQQHK